MIEDVGMRQLACWLSSDADEGKDHAKEDDQRFQAIVNTDWLSRASFSFSSYYISQDDHR